MEIWYLGHSSFKIKGKQATLVTDPYQDPSLGIKFPKVEAQIVTVSHNHQDHNASWLIEGEPFVVNQPGEYEIKGVSILGFRTYHDSKQGTLRGENTIYLIEMDSLRICHLGDLGEVLKEEILEELNGVDILMVPVGGFYTIDYKQAEEIITKIEPIIVLPMHFKIPSMGPEYAQLTGIDNFLKSMGVIQIKPLPKLSVFKEKLPQERQIVLLEKKDG